MFVIFILAFSSSVAFAARPVPTQTGSQIFVPKNVPITPAMIKAGVSYTDAQSIRAEVEGLKKRVQNLETADQKIWGKINAIWNAVGQIKTMVKTAISDNAANSTRIDQVVKENATVKKEVADLKAGLPAMMKKAVEEGTSKQFENIRKIGQYAFWGLVLAIIGLAIYSYRRKP